MKIALYVPAWPAGSSPNGIVTYASYVVPALRELGHEVYVLTSNVATSASDPYVVDLSQFAPHGGRWERLWSRICGRSLDSGLADRIESALRRLRDTVGIDVLEIEESFGWSARLCSAGIVPVIVRLHGPWFLTGTFDTALRGNFSDRIEGEGLGIARASMITSPSAAGLDAVRQEYGLALTNAKVIPNPIKTVVLGSEWSFDQCDRDRILYVGRFDLLKGADLVLEAFRRLAASRPTLRLTFVGPDKKITRGTQEHSLDQFIANYLPDIQSKVDYLGVVHSDDLIRLRRQHLFTIVASRFEMFSYAVAEAMAMGCPIVASAAGGIPELISDGKNGLLFEPGNVESLVKACETFLRDTRLLSQVGLRARQFSERQLSPVFLAKETEKAYSTAIELGRDRGASLH